MVITFRNGQKVVTRKPITTSAHTIPGTNNHRRYIVYTPVGRRTGTREVAFKEVESIVPGYKVKDHATENV